MGTESYLVRRQELTTYFDRTAASAWKALTSDAPVNRIRRTVRAGRDAMRARLLDWLPGDLRGRRLLDAGCGTGALAVEAARRGADVVAIDVAESLIDVARRRMPECTGEGTIEFLVGDMLDDTTGEFDHVVAMDSLIHYSCADAIAAIDALATRTTGSILFTFAPRTLPLAAMHFVGRLIPHRSNRAPSIVPVSPADLSTRLEPVISDRGWSAGRTHRINCGFYISQALELRRSCNA